MRCRKKTQSEVIKDAERSRGRKLTAREEKAAIAIAKQGQAYVCTGKKRK